MTMKIKKKYLICVKQTDYQYIEVDAESLAEARMIADHKDYDKAFNDDPAEVSKYDIPKEYEHEINHVCEYPNANWIDAYPVFHIDAIPNQEDDDIDSYSESEYRNTLALYEKHYSVKEEGVDVEAEEREFEERLKESGIRVSPNFKVYVAK